MSTTLIADPAATAAAQTINSIDWQCMNCQRELKITPDGLMWETTSGPQRIAYICFHAKRVHHPDDPPIAIGHYPMPVLKGGAVQWDLVETDSAISEVLLTRLKTLIDRFEESVAIQRDAAAAWARGQQ